MPRSIGRAALVRASSATIAGFGVVASLLAAMPAQAAVAAPGGLGVENRNSSTPILSWTRVAKATGYQVQVDNDPGFGSPEYNVATANNRAVPTAHLFPGTAHWRVRTVSGKETSSWSGGQFQVGAVDVPVPTHPADGATLQQPQSPPLLRWNTSKGATSYVVEVDGDSDFIGAKAYSTQTTSLVVPDPLAEGDYFWRVIASKGKGLSSAPSVISRFDVAALPAPALTYPQDSVNISVGDVVLDWEPVAGAKSYDVQVALNQSFTNVVLNSTGIRGTRYSPVTTLNNDQFWWRVRAVDLGGQTSAWRESVFSFRREWLDKPQPVYPLGAVAAPAAADPARQFYEWTPVRFASYYELVTARDENFSVNVEVCEVVGTTYVPRDGDCGFPTSGPLFWKVRARDLPYRDDGLPGIFSDTQAFTWSRPAPTTFSGTFAPVTGLEFAMTGSGIGDPAKGCPAVQSNVVGGDYVPPVACTDLGATPVIAWEPQDGVSYYQVVFAQDPQFTTTELDPIITTNHMLAIHRRDDKTALPESEVGLPYLVYVRPCVIGVGCGPSPVSSNPPLKGIGAFSKVSPAVTGLTSSDPAGTDITFSWHDYHATNRAVTFSGELGTQSARNYRVQVDDEPSFTAPRIDEKVVDQATYTAFDTLYPEGRLYWRVQAIDEEGNNLTWSDTQSLVKSSPAINLLSPVGGAAVAGTTPFEWAAQAWANQYTLEVYRNNDTTFSTANRVFAVTTRNASYAWNRPVPASAQPYVWRVRRIDSAGNPGPWSAPGRFVSTGQAPELLAPGNGTWQPGTGVFLEWSDVAGAASYRLSLASDGGKTQSFTTVGTAYAPSTLATGTYTWTVTSLDSDGQVLGTSATRSFAVDATAPTVVKVRPGKLKPKSTIKVVFSEKVKGVSKRSVKLKWQKGGKGKYKAVKVKVKTAMGGKVAVVDPKGRLKPGTYKLLLNTGQIKDPAGNALVAKAIEPTLGR